MTTGKIIVTSRDNCLASQAKTLGQVLIADDLHDSLDLASSSSPSIIIIDKKIQTHSIDEFIASLPVHNQPPIIAIIDSAMSKQPSESFVKGYRVLYVKTIADIGLCLDNSNDDEAGSNSDSETFFINSLAEKAGIAGKSIASVKTMEMIKLVACSQCNPMLIVGQTGTGKELAAKAVHYTRSPDKEFVAINCAALTENLLESELFGHVKGSFTGADREKTGLLELASDGTLFLDEISEMPLQLQAKLLRVLQDKTFRKVGGTKTINCRATIIASSNRNLYQQAQDGRFRADLYYRLSICPITLYPLNSPERQDDIALLVSYFIKNSIVCPEKRTKIKSLTKLALESLQSYHWPGNIRELRNVIERAVLLETTDKIGLSSIIIDASQINTMSNPETVSNQIKNFSLSNAEKNLISRALQETHWQKTQAASLLGITRATLYSKVKQYKIQKEASSISSSIASSITSAEIVTNL